MKRNRINQRIGIFGGTFDPPHVGHLIIAEQAVGQLRLDKLIFIPAFLPPHKRKGGQANPLQRLRMVRSAIKNYPKFAVSAMEIRRGGISYTIDTLRELQRRYPLARFYLIVGGDNFATLKSWKSVGDILNLASIVVYARSSHRQTKKSPKNRRIIHLRGALLGVSSTMIRERVKRGESIKFLTPETVRHFIERNKLYL